MDKTDANAKEVKLLGNGGRRDPSRLTDGRAGPTRLINAGEKAMLAAAEADSALRKSCPPQAKEGASAKEGESPDSGINGWTRVVGHAF